MQTNQYELAHLLVLQVENMPIGQIKTAAFTTGLKFAITIHEASVGNEAI